jgi:hypothetical protein
MHFDNRVSVEERYNDKFAPMSEQDRADFDAVNRSITVFGLLVLLSGFLGLAMIVIGTIEHVSR